MTAKTLQRMAILMALALPGTRPARAQFYDGHMGAWQGEWGWGHMVVGGVMMVLFWAAVIGLVVLLVRAVSGGSRGETMSSWTPRATALDVLEERFARGEISREEFEDRRQVLLASRGTGRSGQR